MNELAQKTQILRDSIKYIADIDIIVTEHPYSTVSIGDDIFLQGYEADQFIDDARSLYHEYGTIAMEEAYKVIALPWF